MKRVLILFFVCWFQAFCAVNATVQWDVRTTGNDANGGGFDPALSGTDYSQQNTAQQAYVDLVIGVTTTQLTSALHAFGSTAPGNIINITGGTGCTVGRYEVLSEAGITATMDRSVGTAASICTGNLGGGLLTMAAAATAATTVSGNTVNIKAGTYTTTSTLGLFPAGITGGFETAYVGYQTTHGDGGTKPLITTATNSTVLITIAATGENTLVFDNLSLSNTAGTKAVGLSNSGGMTGQLVVSRSIMDGFTTAISPGNVAGQALAVINTEIKNSTTGASSGCGSMLFWGASIHDTTGNRAVQLNSATFSASFINSLFYNNVTSINGLVASSANEIIQVINTTLANSTSGLVLNTTAANPNVLVLSNSIIYGNSSVGISFNNSVKGSGMGQNNAFGGNGTDRTNFAALPGDIALSANPFTSSTNFALNSTAGGGAVLKAAGFPGAFPGGTTTGYLDVGAVQGAAPAASNGCAVACVQ